jgi:hypothetical protein
VFIRTNPGREHSQCATKVSPREKVCIKSVHHHLKIIAIRRCS